MSSSIGNAPPASLDICNPPTYLHNKNARFEFKKQRPCSPRLRLLPYSPPAPPRLLYQRPQTFGSGTLQAQRASAPQQLAVTISTSLRLPDRLTSRVSQQLAVTAPAYRATSSPATASKSVLVGMCSPRSSIWALTLMLFGV